MSQGGSAPRPTSRHSSRSPARATDAASSPPLQRIRTQQDDQRPQPLHDSGGIALIQGDGTGQDGGNRPSDTRSILNPTGTHGDMTEQFRSFTQPPAVAGGHPQPAMGAGQYEREASPSRPVSYQTQGSTTPQSAVPSTTSPAGQPTSGDRGSPHPVHPYPMAARRILTPKSPRSVSLSRAAMRTVEAQHHLPTSLAGPSPRGAIPAHDAQVHGSGPSPLGTPPQFYSSGSGQGPMEPSPTRPTSSLARSLSHPSLSHGLPPAPRPETLQQPGSLKRERSGRPVLSGPPFAAPLPASQPFGTSGILGDTRWASGLLGSIPVGGARNLPITEGQPVLTITPSHGEEIVVPVDVHQGSKVADQKRQRNAGASARFRQRKKERERSQQEELQKLENANRELESRNEELAKRFQELEAQRDFYRNDRNRLRDIVSQLPGGKEWADRGPRSPISWSAGAPFAPSSSVLLAQQPPPPAPHGLSQPQHHPPPFPQALANPLSYSHPRSSSHADASPLEPPARRRRTDSEPQLRTGSYSLMTPTPFPPTTSAVPPPPLPAASFGIPPSPHVTPPPLNARLPPLRFDQARTPSTTPPPVPTVPPPPAMPPQSGSPYVTTRRLPYETGWATDPRPEPDNGPR